MLFKLLLRSPGLRWLKIIAVEVTKNKTDGGLVAIKPKKVLKKSPRRKIIFRLPPFLLFTMNIRVLTKILIRLHFKEVFELRDDGAELVLDDDALPDPKRQLAEVSLSPRDQ